MSRQNRYSPEVRERAVRLVLDHQGEHQGRAREAAGVVE
jgi:transposase-like protein